MKLKFHINTYDGEFGIRYYAVRNSDGKEGHNHWFKWMAWISGWFL